MFDFQIYRSEFSFLDRVNASDVEQEFENFPHEMSAGQVRS